MADNQEKIASPSIEEWRRLYDVARDFKQIAPWEWMRDSDMFSVQNPVKSLVNEGDTEVMQDGYIY